jgi:CrcB protein
MEQLKTMTALFIGGGFGTLLRYGLSKIGNPWSAHFFWGTFSVNTIGCFLLGLIVGISYKNPALASAPLYSFLAIGLCGGFTTFSTFAFENQAFLKNGQILEFSVYTLSSIIIGVLAISLGLYSAKAI